MPDHVRLALETALASAFEVEQRATATRIAIEIALGRDVHGNPAMIPLGAAAIDWRVSDETVRRWAMDGKVRAEKLGGRWFVQAGRPSSRVEFVGVNHTEEPTKLSA